ncbi:MAG: hypothetical protein K5648_05800 [Erysipelotrichaceae bacterium]|nr:hypothetical protein [Erysipelotrichaceae bacterium]
MERCLVSKTDNCKNCYKCIRSCRLKAISFENDRASIIHEDCVLCGSCYNICPQKLKVVRNDVSRVKKLIAQGKTYVSLAPSFVSYYPDSDILCMKETLKELGFEDAEETAVGATIVKNAYDRMLEDPDRDVIISSCCHAVNILIQKHFPECRKYLADVLSPMCAHGLNLKQRYEGANVVFIGPCIAKKDEGDHSEHIDAVLTFEELDGWLEDEGIVLKTTEEKEVRERSKARLFPESGGILKTMKCENKDYDYLVVDGMKNCMSALEDLKAGKLHKCFIEMSSCQGSCVAGPIAKRKKASILTNTHLVNKYAGDKDFDYEGTSFDDIRTVYDRSPIQHREPSDEEVEKMLVKMGKKDLKDRLNCGCCGYDSCRAKAAAIIKGHANIDMCLPLLMEKSQSLANNIVDNTPNGLMVLDEELNIGLINNTMCRMLSLANSDSVIGQHVAMILDPSDYFEALSGKKIENKYEYLNEYEKYIEKTVSYDEKFKVLVCVFRDITEEEIQKQEKFKIINNTVSITDSLLEQNMRSVHEIASLLGETAAETKIALEKLKGLVKSDGE